MSHPRLLGRWSGRSAAAITALLLVVSACSEPVAPPVANTKAPATGPRPSLSLIGGASWSANGPGTVTLNNSGATGDPSMSYAFSGPGAWSGQNWTFGSTAAAAGPIAVNYAYSGYHAWFMVRVWLYAYVTHNSVTTETLLGSWGPASCCSGAPSGGFNYSGSHTFNVQGGDSFGFRFGGSNGDSDWRLLGTMTVSQPRPADTTPPVITPTVTGTLGNNGWYTSNVGLTWSVTDAESAISSQSGCGAESVTADTPGASFTCSATSAGGTSSASVTVKRDATPPVIAFSGNAGSYTVDQTVAISCSATDATSGIASSNCPGASGDAYLFVGTQTLNASATDNAGNGATGSTSFTVSVTSGSLCTLVGRWVSQHGVANSMCQQLANGAYGAFVNHVNAQSGKTVSADHAALLIALLNDMLNPPPAGTPN